MPELIEGLMLGEHARILKFLKRFEEHITPLQNLPAAKKMFQKFKWNLEKHFFLEEKSIFMIYNDMQGQEVSDIFDLMKEHGTIMAFVKNIENSLMENVSPDLRTLRNILIMHARFEDRVFYPRLDDELSLEQKKEIAERVKDIMRG
jgi:hemerythrin-like domain-containing protein